MTLGSDSSCNGRAPPPEPRPARDPQAGSNRTGGTCHCDDRRPRPGIEPGSVKPVTHQESMNRTDLFICSQGQSPLRSNGIRPRTDPNVSTKVDTHQEQLMPFRQIVEICRRRGGSGCGGVSRMGPRHASGGLGRTPNPGLAVCAGQRTRASRDRAYMDVLAASPATGPTPPSLSRPAVAVAVAVASEVAGQRPALPAGAGCNPAANPIPQSGSWVVCLIRCIGISVLVFCTPAIRFRCCIWNCR